MKKRATKENKGLAEEDNVDKVNELYIRISNCTEGEANPSIVATALAMKLCLTAVMCGKTLEQLIENIEPIWDWIESRYKEVLEDKLHDH